MTVTLIFVEMNLGRRRQVCKFLLSPYFTLPTPPPPPPNLTKIKTHRRGDLCSGVPAGVRALCGDKYSGKLRDKASAALHAENLFLGIQLQSSTLQKCSGEIQWKIQWRNTVEKYSEDIQLNKALHAENLFLGIQLLHRSSVWKCSSEIQFRNTLYIVYF